MADQYDYLDLVGPGGENQLKGLIADMRTLITEITNANKAAKGFELNISGAKNLKDVTQQSQQLVDTNGRLVASYSHLSKASELYTTWKQRSNGSTDAEIAGTTKVLKLAELEAKTRLTNAKALEAETRARQALTKEQDTATAKSEKAAAAERKRIAEIEARLNRQSALEKKIADAKERVLRKQEAAEDKAIAQAKEAAAVAAQKAAIDARANDSLKTLSATLEQHRKSYYLLTQAERENANIGGALLGRIQELDKQLKVADATMGRHQRNVGNYGSAFNGLGFSIRNIAGELPNIGISFRTFAQSISNNIGPLTEALSQARMQNALLAAEGKKTIPIGKQIAGAVFSWQTAILALVAAFTYFAPKLIDYVFNTDKASKAQEKLKKETEELAEFQKELATSQANSIGRLRALYEITQDLTISEQDRTNAVKELQREFPAYFANMSTEAILAGKATDAYLDLTDALMSKAAAQVYQGKVNEELSKEIDLQTKIIDKQAELNKLRGGSTLAFDPKTGVETFTQGDPAVDSKRAEVETELLDLQRQQSEAVRKRMGYMDQVVKRTTEELKIKRQDKKENESVDSKPSPKVEKEKDATKELLEELAIQSENEALIQKGISEDHEKSLQERLDAYEKYTFNEINAAGLRLAGEANAEAKWQLAITKIVQQAVKDRAKIQDDEAKKQAAAAAQLIEGVGTPDAQRRLKGVQDKEQERKRANEQIAQQSIQLAGSLADVNSNLTQRRIKEIDAEIAAINKKTEAEIAGIEKSGKSAQEKEQAIAEAKARAEAQITQLENDKRNRLRRAAQVEKAVTIAQIIASTALAVVRQLGALPAGPQNIPLALAIGALGAGQLAAAIAAPLPQFAKGVDSSPEGLAITDEKGPEFYIERDGTSYFGSDKGPTVRYLKEGTKIIPHDEIMAMTKMYNVGLPSLRTQRGMDTRNLERKMDEVKQAIRNQPQPILSITGEGVRGFVKTGQNMQEWINNIARG